MHGVLDWHLQHHSPGMDWTNALNSERNGWHELITEKQEILVQMNGKEWPNRRRIQLKYFVTYLCSPWLDKNRKAREVIGLADS